MGPGRTSTVHGCPSRWDVCGWPDTTTTSKKTTAHSNMVAEQVLTYGLVDGHERQCDDSRMARGLCLDCGCVGTGRIAMGGPGDRDLDVWSLQRSVDDCRMLRWSSSSFARVCQRVLQNLSFSGAERDGWCQRCHLRSICLPDFECRSSR